jgi:plastocyanin
VRCVAGRLAFAALCVSAVMSAAWAGALQVQVTWPDGRPAGGMAITVTSADGTRAPAAPVSATMDQVDRAFTPELLVVPVGSSVAFPNSDVINHQVYSFSKARRFQLPLYHGTAYPPLRFDTPGLVVLGCNIHDSMVGYIVVTEAQYFGLSDARGTFDVASVPDGDYDIRVSHPRMRASSDERAGHVRVSGATRAHLVVTLQRDLRPAPIKGKSRQWDY